MNRIGKRIQARRQAKGMKIVELAVAVDKTPRHIELIESGQRLPSIPTLYLVAQALDTTPARLLDDAAEDPSSPSEPLARAG